MYISKQVVRFISLILALILITFLLVEFSPIDPVEAYLGNIKRISPEQKQEIRERWGVDKPVLEKISNWLKEVSKGNFGYSFIYNKPVISVVIPAIQNSLLLMFSSWVLSFVFGIVLGIIGAIKRDRLVDKIIKFVCHLFNSIPTFWFGILLVIVFSVYLKIFPIGLSAPIGKTEASFGERIYHMILPCLTLSIIGISGICLHTREKMIEVLNSNYSLYELAKGKSKKEIAKNFLRNIMLPVVTIQFASISELFSGSVLIENVFSYYGLGNVTVAAGIKGDIELLLFITILTGAIVFVGNLIANLLYPIIDPRIKEAQYES